MRLLPAKSAGADGAAQDRGGGEAFRCWRIVKPDGGNVVELFHFCGMLRATMNEWRFKLLYDGQCPMCRREANWLMRRNRAGHLAFEDISAPDFDASRFGLTHEQVMGVMHGVFPDGRIVTKVEAFRQAYRQVGLGWLLAPTGWPVMRELSNWGYEWFARNRVAIGQFFGGESCNTGRCSMSTPEKLHRRIPPADD